MTAFHTLLRDGAERYGAKPAVLFDDQTLSYADLLKRTERLAAGFRAYNITEGDHVAIVMDNSFECILAWLAVSVLGSTDVPVNPQYRGDLLRYLLEDAEATVVVCDEDYLADVVSVAPALPLLRLIVVNGEGHCDVPARLMLVRFDQMEHAATFADVANAPERIILYTSGTTGPSKGVVHSQKSCLVLARYNAQVLDYGVSDRLLNFFPLYHQNARYTGVVPALCAGATIRVERRFSSSAFWRICDADATTAFNYLGSVLRLILNVTPPDKATGRHTIRKAFGAGAPPLLWDKFEKHLGIKLFEVYGLSEAPMATVNARTQGRPSPIGSAGKASDLFEVAIVDEQDRVLPAGAIGEIVMRPKIPDAIMIGYQNKDAATVQAFRNLWFHSGDRGRLSGEGDLYFEERSKDSIRRRGENISAWEVESVLDQHPAVVESAVYGLPSDESDEEVTAALVLKEGQGDLAAILRHAEALLPKYAVPTLLRVLSDLPRTPTAKVQKSELRAAGRDGCLSAAAINAGTARD